MFMRRLCFIVSLLVVSVSQLFGQSDTPATREDILKLFDTMKIHDQMRLVMDSVLKQQRAMIHEAIRKHQPNVSEDELKHLDSFMTDIMKDMPVNELLDDMIPVYQKHLNKGDVGAMDAFYSSSTGQKLLREMPAMTAESMQAANPHMQAMMEKVMNRVEQEAQQEREKHGDPPKQGTIKD